MQVLSWLSSDLLLMATYGTSHQTFEPYLESIKYIFSEIFFTEFKLGLKIWLNSQERLLSENPGSIPRTNTLLTTVSNSSPKGSETPRLISLGSRHTRDM